MRAFDLSYVANCVAELVHTFQTYLPLKMGSLLLAVYMRRIACILSGSSMPSLVAMKTVVVLEVSEGLIVQSAQL